MAAKALEQLAVAAPDRAAGCIEKTAEVRQRQFDAAKADEKAAAGEALIAAILALAGTGTQAETDVAALYKRAQKVARAIKSARTEEIDALAAALAQKMKTAHDIAEVKALLEMEPANTKVRERLVRLHLIDLDDPAEAAKYVEGVADESLKKLVPAAAKPLEEAPELACLELGEWYRQLGGAAPLPAKAAMFARAKAYYERFLALHAAEDLDRMRATAALLKLAAAPAAPSPKPAPPIPSPQPGAKTKKEQWIDLLPLVALPTDVVKGDWVREGNSLALTATRRREESRIQIPLALPGSYELQVRFVRTSGRDTVVFTLPVASTDGGLFLSARNGVAHGLSNVNDKTAMDNGTAIAPGTLENGREYALEIKVIVQGDQVSIDSTLDGKPCVRWQGPLSVLSSQKY